MTTTNNSIVGYQPTPTAWKFHNSKAFVRGIRGPIGCVHGDTKVITEFGPKPISEITRPMRILSWNEKTSQFQLSLTGGAFPKGKDYLYRVTTTQGELVASGHHLMLCADRSYRRVDTLSHGQTVSLCSDNQLLSSSACAPLTSLLNVGRYSQKDVDYLGGYATLARQYGQQLLPAVKDGPVSPPSPGDAQQSVCHFLTHERTRHDQLNGQTCTGGSVYQPQLQHASAWNCASVGLCERNEGLTQLPLQSELKCEHHPKAQESFSCFHSSLNSSSVNYGSIISIEKLKVKEVYWDLQVLDTNNYVTTDGSINHNSGKSVACCFEIFIRACEQVPNKNGIRKSRWLVVRNTLPQLETTTMKTWVDWFPPGDPTKGYFGKMTGKPPYTHKILYMLGDDTTVDLEVQFLALDKPEDVKKLLSYECSGVWFNEAREIPKELLDAATGRVGRYPSAKDGGCTRRTIILDTNPPDDSHWWYHLAEEDTPDNWEFFEQPSGLSHEAENLENLVQPANFEELSLAERREHGKEYYKQMIGGKTEEWIKVYVKGQYGFIKEGQPVYKGSWNDNIHVAKSPILWSPNSVITVGVDSSGRHPAAVFLQRNSRGQVQVLGELCILDEEGMGASNYAPLLKSRVSELFPGNTLEFWGDPAGGFKTQNDEQTYFDILKANGIFIKASPGFRLPQRIETVISILSRMVDGEPALLVSPACKHLIKGFNGGYQYKRISTSGDATYSEKPHKNRFSDVQDALQYGLCGMGEMRQMLGRNKGRQKAHTVSKKWSVFGRKGR